MRAHPRIRKTVKWGGAAVTVLLVVVWVGSGWRYAAAWRAKGMVWIVSSGGLVVQEEAPAIDSAGAIYRGQPFQLLLSPRCTHAAPWWEVFIPLWIPALAAATLAIIAWRLDTLARRRVKLNLCPKCGYDRTGLRDAAGGKCPECGSMPGNT
jgi:hypothetical protein